MRARLCPSPFAPLVPLALSLVLAGCSDEATPGADGGRDEAAPADASITAGTDLGRPDLDPGLSEDLGPLPPPAELEVLNGAVGLGAPIVDANPDEAGNLWAVAPDALYIRRAGQAQFRRYTNADGLHIWSIITAVAGAGPNEGYVGLQGHETDYPNLDPPALRNTGKAERVWLHDDGTLTTLHYAEMYVDYDHNSWMERTAERLVYAHAGPARGHLFMGADHGVTHIFNDGWGDHIHVETTFVPENVMSFGLWFGLALDEKTGDLWTCGKTGCGLHPFNPSPKGWVNDHYRYAFSVFTDDHALEIPSGHREYFIGTALAPDGTAYFLSTPYGLAAWKPNGFDYQHIRPVPIPNLGVPADVAADPDGSIWIADRSHLFRFHPDTNALALAPFPAPGVRRLYVDVHVAPRALYVSTDSGLLVYRGK